MTGPGGDQLRKRHTFGAEGAKKHVFRARRARKRSRRRRFRKFWQFFEKKVAENCDKIQFWENFWIHEKIFRVPLVNCPKKRVFRESIFQKVPKNRVKKTHFSKISSEKDTTPGHPPSIRSLIQK